MKKSVNVARLFAVGTALAAAVSSSFAVDPATAGEALSSLSGITSGFGPVLFGLAVTSSGILIGVSWIKKGRSAAK